jgi:hypothetical protein
MKYFCLLLFTLLLSTPLASIHAAAPDGAGPWADSVVTFSQGLTKAGNPVPAPRSDPTAALGVAENDTVEPHFVSLGFGGALTLGFDNGISGGTVIIEATNLGYPAETAKVEVSPDGSTWTLAGNVTQDGQVSMPQSVTCAKFVRITDTSDKANFSDDTADAYDVDGVQAVGDSCQVPTPTPSPSPTPTSTPSCSCGCSNTSVTQTNVSIVSVGASSTANTGKNKVKKNTGAGGNSVTTGTATSNTNVVVTGGKNTTTISPSCCSGGSTNVTISNNGAGSKNKVVIK